jgi:HD-like signal output (HDOD) protein
MPVTAPGKPLPAELQAALAQMAELNSLPEVTTRIVSVVENTRATAHDLHGIVQADPALAAKILKVVNSAFYGLPSQIASLDRAILLLGMSAVKNIALAASLARMFNVDAVCDQFTARGLWRHSIAVGVCSRLVAARSRCTPADEAFVCGLVHDLGLIVSRQLDPAKLREVIERCSNAPTSFCSTEELLIGADHQALGAALAASWHFPPGLQYAIGHHHEPLELAEEPHRINAGLVFVADTLCCCGGFGFALTGRSQQISPDLLALLDLTTGDLDEIMEELTERIVEVERLFAE